MTTSAPLVHHEHPARWPQQSAAVPMPRHRIETSRPAEDTVYACFTCPWSYIASQRSDHIHAPALRPVWRMIDPDAAPGTRLASPGLRLDALSGDRAGAELEAVRALLLPGEHLPAQAPTFRPHTGPAVIGYAEAVGAGVGGPVRRLLFDAYWLHGLDIGLPEVLRRILDTSLRASSSTVRPVKEHGYAVTLTGGPITTDAHDRTRSWHRNWLATGSSQFPALTVGASTTSGPTALTALTAHHATRSAAAGR